MITKEMIDDFFQHTRELRDEGDVVFDIDDDCRWSYFFTDSDMVKLSELGSFLKKQGYEPIGFLEPPPDNEDQNSITLRLDKVEQHTVDSLYERSEELTELTVKYGVSGYDGMDVGAAEA